MRPVLLPQRLVNHILAKLRRKASKNGVYFKLNHRQEWLDNDTDTESSAYFIGGEEPELIVSIKNRLPSVWLVNCIHEDSHMDQWLEKSPLWQALLINEVDVSDIADLWVQGVVDLNLKQRSAVFDPIYELEMDAERRTIQKLYDYGLDTYISPFRYAKEARAYANGYMVTKLCRKWLPAKDPPYNIDKIVNQQPQDMSLPKEHGCFTCYWEHYKEHALAKIQLEKEDNVNARKN